EAQAAANAAQEIYASLPAWQQLDLQLQKIQVDMEANGRSAEEIALVMARTAEKSASSWQSATVAIADNIANAFKSAAQVNKSFAGAAKAAAIGAAIANTAVGATKAYAQWGWPLGTIAAAAIIAAGVAQVALISQQQFATGGSFKVGGGMTGVDSQL